MWNFSSFAVLAEPQNTELLVNKVINNDIHHDVSVPATSTPVRSRSTRVGRGLNNVSSISAPAPSAADIKKTQAAVLKSKKKKKV